MPPVRKPLPPHVVIVGGGLAGLAAASSLLGRGLRITLLDSRPRLGGRASSFTDPVTGEQVDNCQHVSMACCTNLADFCRRGGTTHLVPPPGPTSAGGSAGATSPAASRASSSSAPMGGPQSSGRDHYPPRSTSAP